MPAQQFLSDLNEISEQLLRGVVLLLADRSSDKGSSLSEQSGDGCMDI